MAYPELGLFKSDRFKKILKQRNFSLCTPLA